MNPAEDYNIVRDWNKAQGMTHYTDEHIQIKRDIGIRLISLQNSGLRPVGVAITTYWCGQTPKIQFVMGGGEIKNIGINPYGGPMQFLHLLDLETHRPVGTPYAFRTDSNWFVLRDGLNKYYIHSFKTGAFSAQK